MVINLSLYTATGLVETQKDPIIGIFQQYAHYGIGKTVHSVKSIKTFWFDY
jgi:hypothetical protein